MTSRISYNVIRRTSLLSWIICCIWCFPCSKTRSDGKSHKDARMLLEWWVPSVYKRDLFRDPTRSCPLLKLLDLIGRSRIHWLTRILQTRSLLIGSGPSDTCAVSDQDSHFIHINCSLQQIHKFVLSPIQGVSFCISILTDPLKVIASSWYFTIYASRTVSQTLVQPFTHCSLNHPVSADMSLSSSNCTYVRGSFLPWFHPCPSSLPHSNENDAAD